MSTPIAPIALVGAGRMGRGLAVVFAYAGHDVALIDLKQRDVGQFARLAEEARSEIAATLGTMARLGFFAADDAGAIAGRVRLVPQAEAAAIMGTAIVAGAVAVVPASAEQEQDDEDQQNKAHEIRLSFVRWMRLVPSRVAVWPDCGEAAAVGVLR